MNTLAIYTPYVATTTALLAHHDLIETRDLLPARRDFIGVEVRYPDDGLAQSLAFWLDIAKACGLIDGYTFTHR
jgi:hypothetical protein